MATYNFPPNAPPPPTVTGGPMTMPQALRQGTEMPNYRLKADQARQRQQGWGDSLGQFGQGYGEAAGGHGYVDWGSIIGRGVGNYMQAKERKTAETMEDKGESFQKELFSTFMKDDPKAQEYLQMAQAGIPGADKLLAQHIAPKKEPIAALIQGVMSGAVSPELAQELAPRYGVDPSIAARAAEYAVDRRREMAEQEYGMQSALIDQRLQGQMGIVQAQAGAKADQAFKEKEGPRREKLIELDTQEKTLDSNFAKWQSDLDAFLSHPQFENVYGRQGVIWRRADESEGTGVLGGAVKGIATAAISPEWRDAEARRKNLVEKLGFESIRSLKAQGVTFGAMTEKEYDRARAAATALADAQSAEQARQLWIELKGYMTNLHALVKQDLERQKGEVGRQLNRAPAMGGAPAAGSTIDQFESEADELGF